jgi:TP901 family phage tail tape measure protein
MANPYKVSINITADTDEAVSNIDRLNDEYGELLRSLGKTPEDIRAFSRLAQDFITTGKAADDLDAETRQLLTSYRDLLNVAKSRDILGLVPHDQIARQIHEVESAFDTLKQSGVLSQREIAQASLVTQRRIAELKAQTNGLKDALQSVQSQLAGLAASGAGIGVAVKQAIDFESAMADVAKVTGASSDELERLGRELKEASQSIGLSADELARIAAAGGQLGVPIGQLRTFVDLAARMSVAFGMTADEAGDAVARLTNVFGLALDQIEHVGDAVNVLGNNMAATERDILEVMTRTGGMAKQFGLAAEQTAALAAGMLSLGRSPEVVATSINALLTKLQTASVAGDEFQAALARMGIEATDLADRIRRDPQQALTEFLSTLRAIEPMARSEILVKLFGLEYQDDISALIGSLSQYENALGLVADSNRTAGAMQEEFRVRMQTTDQQLKLLANAVEVVAINLGTTFLPAINRVAGGLTTATSAVADFIEQFPLIAQLATTLVTVAASVGALRAAFLAARLAGIALGTDVGTSIRGLNLPIGQAISAVGRLQAAFGVLSAWMIGWDIGTYLSDKFEIVRKAGVLMVETLVKGWEYVRTGYEVLKAIFTDDTVDAAIERHKQRLADMDAIFASMYREVEDEAYNAAKAAAAAADASASSIQASVEAAGSGIQQVAADTEAALRGIDGVSRQAATSVADILTVLPDGGPTQQSLEQLIVALRDVRDGGDDARQAIVSGLGQALSQLSTQQLIQFQQQAEMTFRLAVDDIDEARAVLDTGLAAALERLGVDTAKLATGLSGAATEAIHLFDAVAESSSASSAQITAAFDAVLAKVDSLQAIDTLRMMLQDLGATGRMSMDDLGDAMDRLNSKAAQLGNELDPVAQAFATLGIESSRELSRLADEARDAFEQIKDSGTASAGDIRRAWDAYAAAATRAAQAQGTAQAAATERTLAAEKAALGLRDALSEAGDTGVEAGQKIATGMSGAEESLKSAAKATKQITGDLTGSLGDVADELKDDEKEAEKSFAAWSDIVKGWDQLSDASQRQMQQLMQDWIEFNQQNWSAGVAKLKAPESYEWQAMTEEIERAVSEMDRLWTDLQTKGMSDELAAQIDAWRRSYGALIDPGEYDPLVRALDDHTRALQEARTEPRAAAEKQPLAPTPTPRVEPQPAPAARAAPPAGPASAVVDGRTVKLLEDIARHVADIARIVASAGSINPDQLAGMVIDRLSTSATRTG